MHSTSIIVLLLHVHSLHAAYIHAAYTYSFKYYLLVCAILTHCSLFLPIMTTLSISCTVLTAIAFYTSRPSKPGSL